MDEYNKGMFNAINPQSTLAQASAGRRRPRRPGFSNSLFRPETPPVYPKRLLTNREGRRRKLGRPLRF